MSADLFNILSIALIGILGACCGSFASALGHRYIHQQDWVAARSACPTCQHPLNVLDLIPVVSWLLRAGRCHYCRTPYGVSYLALEILGALAAIMAYAKTGWTFPLLPIMLALPVLLTLSIIDLRTFLLPDRFVGTLAVLGCVYAAAMAPSNPVMGVGYAMLNAAAYGGLLGVIAFGVGWALKKEALGMGDVKLVAAMGLWLPLDALPFFFLCAGVTGIIVGLVWRHLHGEAIFPFGPALIIAFWAVLSLTNEFQLMLDAFGFYM